MGRQGLRVQGPRGAFWLGCALAAVGLALPSAAAGLQVHYLKEKGSAKVEEQAGATTPECPPGESVASGGARPAAFGMAVHATYPTGSLDRWRVVYDNRGEVTTDFTAYAICVDREASVKTKSSSGTGRRFATVACRNGPYEPTGGGLNPAGGFGASFLEEQGVESSEDNAAGGRWHTVARGFGLGDSLSLTAYGICMRVNPRYATKLGPDGQPDSTRTALARCKGSERVIGGGGFLSTNAPADPPPAYIAGSYPVDRGSDGDRIPDDAWRIRIEREASLGLASVLAFAICV